MNSSVNMLKINHNSKNFDGIAALQNVSLDIQRGEFFSILLPKEYLITNSRYASNS
ncbi:MAG: hypothetical protein AB1775_10635 [Bacteroidota bacterium]